VQQSLAFWSAPSTPPGGDPVYTSTGYVLLGMLVEHVTHHSVAQALRADLFSRAGLERIAAQDTERPTAPVAAPGPELGVASRDGYLPCRSVASLGNDSASGVAADASTLATWGYQLYGGRVLPAQLTAMMLTPASSAAIFPGIGYGLGTMLFDRLSADVAAGHEGDLRYYSSTLVVVPARHESIAVLADGSMPDPPLIVRQLLNALT
jgi:D-alanyl-D-alanine carboxypeptidase